MTNQYKVQYDERKSDVLNYLDDCIQQLKEWGEDKEALPLEKFKSAVADDLFTIVLVGEFSSGKSTFLNALMHKRILPAFTSETTATVNFLRHCDQAPDGVLGRVYYRDGHTEDLANLDPTTIEGVVSTKGDNDEQTVAATVERVELFLDSAFLQNGVMLVDSPGLNGMKANHREITERQIKASHACIFMFRAEQPGSKTEFETLRELKSQSNNIFFVLNKIDAIRSSENQTVEGVIQDLRSTYHKQFPEEDELPKIWPVASFAALVARDTNEGEYLGGEVISTQERRAELEEFSRFSAFEDRLWKYLTQGERAHDQLYNPVYNTVKLFVSERDKYGKQLNALQKGPKPEDLQKQKEALEANLRDLQKNRQTISPELRKEVTDVVRHWKETASSQSTNIQRKIMAHLEDCESPAELAQEAAYIPEELDKNFRLLTRELDEQLRDELLRIVNEHHNIYILDLDERFTEISESNPIQFNKGKIEISDISIGIDLEKFDEECKSLIEQIQKLDTDLENTELSCIRAKAIEGTLKEKADQLKDLYQSRQFINDTFIIPPVTYRHKEVETSRKRGGILGWIGNLLLGEKHVTSMQEVEDHSAQDNAIAQKNERLKDLDEQIKVLEKYIDLNEKPAKSSYELEYNAKKIQNKITKLEQNLKELQEKHLSELDSKSAKACKRILRKIRNEVESTCNEVSNLIRKHVQDQERQYLRAVNDLLNVTLEQEIASAQKQLKDIESAIEADEEGRQIMIENATQAYENAQKLVERGINLYAMLDEKMSDHIEQEAF